MSLSPVVEPDPTVMIERSQLSRRAFVGTLPLSLAALSATLEAAVSGAEPASETPWDLHDTLAAVLADSGLPALAAGAMKRGRLVALGAVGVRMVGASAEVTVEDKFHIGSCTKAMTATLAAMLLEQGKLKWDSTLTNIFPERRERMNAAFRNVTLAMLLTHRAGLAHDGTYYGKAGAPVVEQRLAYMDAILAKPPKYEIDTFNYSNAGYIIAGAMLERVTGKPWEDLMREKVFRPLDMPSAGFGVAATERQADQPWGHVLKDGKFVPRYGDNHRALGPAGTVHCNIRDYLKFAGLHASMGARPPGLLTKAICEKLHQPAKNNYAMGWAVVERDWAHGKALTHAGSNTMNYFVVWVAPEIDFALAVASNAAGDKALRALDRVAGELVRHCCA